MKCKLSWLSVLSYPSYTKKKVLYNKALAALKTFGPKKSIKALVSAKTFGPKKIYKMIIKIAPT